MFDSNFNFPDNYWPILAHSHVDRHCRCCLALHCNLYHISIFDSVCFLYLLASVLLAYFHAWPSLPYAVNNCCSLPPILNWIDARHGFPSSTLCCSFYQLFDAPYTIIGIDQICRSLRSDRTSQFCTVTLPSPWVFQKKNSIFTNNTYLPTAVVCCSTAKASSHGFYYFGGIDSGSSSSYYLATAGMHVWQMTDLRFSARTVLQYKCRLVYEGGSNKGRATCMLYAAGARRTPGALDACHARHDVLASRICMHSTQ